MLVDFWNKRGCMPHIVDWPGRLKEMADFVGLGEEELALIRETSSVVLEHADALTASVYDNFLKFPGSRKFFLNENGEVDEVRLDRRKHSLARWLRGSIDFKIDEDYPIRVLATGIVHSHPPVHRAHLGSIPSRFMIGTMSFTQTALADLLHREIKQPDVAMRAAVAWNKLLMLQLDILLAGYLTETPTEPEDGAGHQNSTGPA